VRVLNDRVHRRSMGPTTDARPPRVEQPHGSGSAPDVSAVRKLTSMTSNPL
jgi:hypothetical protein